MKIAKLSFAIALGLSSAGGLLLMPGKVVAQDDGDKAKKTLDEVTVIGSRRTNRTSDTASPVPVDVLQMEKAATEGIQLDLAQALQYTAPSFNSTRQTGADGADIIDSAALRGLGSDQTLVLVNGKRRHTVALVNLFGARNRGNTGTDLNAIPQIALSRVEVLRDGAAAQYGSDAIAGVMNLVLRKDEGCNAVFGYGQYTRGDGINEQVSSYCGFGIGDGGSIGISGDITRRGRSDRSEPKDNPRIIGDTKVDNRTIFVNGDLPLGEAATLYFTAGAQNRQASSAAFAREGVGSEDIPSRNSAAIYPNGFVPYINAWVPDRYSTFGVWGMWGGWRSDLSWTRGFNKMRYTIANTLNASIANDDRLRGGRGLSPTVFDAGGFSFKQNTFNLDFSQYFEGLLNGTNIAFGSEVRSENYDIRAGEPGSYIDADGPGGGSAGSQGFPGFQPADVTRQDRLSEALYGDFENTWNEAFTTDAALRYEHFDDFGSTITGKLAGAYKLNDAWTLRGGANTGFRAPSLQQRYFSSTFTDFVSGQPVDVLLAPNGGRIANAVGIPSLKEEKSTNLSFGVTATPTDTISITVDAYRIAIKDRIVLSGRFDTTDDRIGSILESLGVGQAQFFVNSVDTKTTGLDITASDNFEVGEGKLNAFIALNINKTEVNKIKTPPALIGKEDVLLSERERLFIEQGAPRSKAILGFDYSGGAWDGSWKFIYFGTQTLGTFSGPPVPNAKYSPKVSADASVSYHYNDATTVTLGGSNIFDRFPSRQDPNETDNGHVFDSVQFGLNGAAYYLRLAYKF
jgi:iron complex outermembrane recepter protein